MNNIKLISLFAGIGAFEFGAYRVYDNVDIVAAAEIDKYARISYMANHSIDESKFYEDVKLLDGKKYKNKYDCLCFGFPCQDYSIAGLRAGLDGQRGTLFYEAARILKDSMPSMFIAENVKGLLSSNKGKDFKVIISILRDIGYNVHYEVLNTKDYGVPQNRERIFLVGFKDIEHYYNFSFAPKIKLEKRLKDILEGEVDEKYYLKDINTNKRLKKTYNKHNENLKDATFIDSYNNSIFYNYSPCLSTRTDASSNSHIYVKSATKKGYETALPGDSINLTHPESKTRRGRVGKQVAQTLDCACNQSTLLEDYRIRKLTPRECFRLQDFPDTFKQVVSNRQAYKQAGNSISVNMSEMIFRQIELSRYENTNTDSLF